jgi:hypothetical protein
MSMHIGTRIPHASLSHEYRAAIRGYKKMISQYWPDMCCMCLLRGLNGHIRVTCLTSRISVSSWPPELLSSSPDAHWPPLEARVSRIHLHLIDMRCISANPRGRGGRGCVCHALVLLQPSTRPLWLLPSAPPPPPSLPLGAHRPF